MNDSSVVLGVYAGHPALQWRDHPQSSIKKSPIAERTSILASGLVGDQQADLEVHGGPDKALHFYSASNLPFWETKFPNEGFEFVPGCFGENISANGLLDAEVCVGDIFQLGTSLVQITQGRTPCWKLNMHTGIKEMAYYFAKERRTGFYCRVLEAGEVEVGSKLALIDRPNPDFSVALVTLCRYRKQRQMIDFNILAEIDGLSENWKSAFKKFSQSRDSDCPERAWEYSSKT